MRTFYNASIVIDSKNNNVKLCFQMYKDGNMHEKEFDGVAEAVAFCNENRIYVSLQNCYAIQ